MRYAMMLCLAAAMAFPGVAAGSQSLLERSPNVSGDWVGQPGTLYFHFVHRFATSGAPERKVSNVPTFLVAAGLPMRLLAGFNYSTNSTLAPRFPNEWELFARWLPLSQDRGAGVDVGSQVGYNNAADGIDAEISVGRRLGVTRVMLAGRALSNPLESGDARFALAGGGTIRLGQFVSLAGDVSSLLDRDSSERVAWSAGIHFAIPLTPHTVSLHATNSMLTTLQGASRGMPDVRYGFEFTIPLTLRRYFGRRAEPGASVTDSSVVAAASVSASDTVRRSIKNLTFGPPLVIKAGTTVEWTNDDPLPHTVTAVDKSFDSGLVDPGGKFRYTFTKAGTFSFFCVPHPFMKGTVEVRQP